MGTRFEETSTNGFMPDLFTGDVLLPGDPDYEEARQGPGLHTVTTAPAHALPRRAVCWPGQLRHPEGASRCDRW